MSALTVLAVRWSCWASSRTPATASPPFLARRPDGQVTQMTDLRRSARITVAGRRRRGLLAVLGGAAVATCLAAPWTVQGQFSDW
jgi:hypothetical protein